MTISSTNRKAGPFECNGVLVAFPFEFRVFEAADVKVVHATTLTGVETVLEIDVDYSVVLNPDQENSPGGEVTLFVAKPIGDTITLASQVAILQPLLLTTGGNFRGETVMTALDRQTAVSQQLAETQSRGLELPISAPSDIDLTLPLPVPGNTLAWDSLGKKLVNIVGFATAAVSSFMAGVVAAADATAALTGLGGSATGRAVFTGDAAAGRAALSVPSAAAVTSEISAAVGAIPAQIQTITAVPTANTLVVSSPATSLDFRSATQGSGVVTPVLVPALTLTVPSGATLGTINAKEATLQYGVLLNGSTPEPFIYNVSHGNNVLNEEGLITTTALSAASDSEDGIYSTAARTNVPYRILGSVTLTQAVAGTWVTNPTKIQGAGGLALLKNAKYAYTAETGNRVSGTTYYNIWGRTIWVLVSGSSVAGSTSATGLVDGTARIVNGGFDGNGGQAVPSITFPVPEGSSYSVAMAGSAISNWQEFR